MAHAALTEEQEINYVHVLNRLLPEDIRVIAWAPVARDFDARFVQHVTAITPFNLIILRAFFLIDLYSDRIGSAACIEPISITSF